MDEFDWQGDEAAWKLAQEMHEREQLVIAEFEEQRRFEEWRDRRLADGEDCSEMAYLDWLESALPVD